ncbi:DUF952 domain-containing protein [Tsukamurella spumae]|uniref:DUF952 domain-containing protein n=1 Tax=Tsukamurella spumae TaxID=44753 RepID=A0A846X2N6_9ACTN|nr:DUF952 domain-containing protein [Tsukamurella spumae]NKY18826.1 DUF952 domain-containing protein [Tsukamurella spumae]
MIFHLALVADWNAARAAGEYTVSTRGASLADVGFVHCSTAEQWRGVRERFYADVPVADLVLLSIDPTGLDVRYEPPAPGVEELFPHVYGPIPVSAVETAGELHVASFPETSWGEADLAVLPDDGHRYEIVDGSLLMTPPPSQGHQSIGGNLFVALRLAMPRGFRGLYEVGVRVQGGNLIPDIVVLQPGAARVPVWSESEDVVLVVEIASRSTRVTDRTLKAAKYAEAMIPSYWRVDADGTVTIHTDPDGLDYTRTQVVRPGERLHVDVPFPVDLDAASLIE